MRTHRCWSFVPLVLLVGCEREPSHDVYAFLDQPRSISSTEQAAIWDALPYARIELTRFPGYLFGTHGPYHSSVVLHRNGVAELEGTLADGRSGTFLGEVGVRDYGRLCQLLDRLELDTLEESYSVEVTHQETVILRATRGQDEPPIEVQEYGGVGPFALWTIHRAIEAIAHGIDWQTPP